MKEQIINYETFITISNAISHSKEPLEIALMTVEGIKTALDIKGCALFLLNHKTQEIIKHILPLNAINFAIFIIEQFLYI